MNKVLESELGMTKTELEEFIDIRYGSRSNLDHLVMHYGMVEIYILLFWFQIYKSYTFVNKCIGLVAEIKLRLRGVLM